MHINWWTLALQTVNVLILIWILGRFFFRPVAGIVAKRQEEAKRLLADAAAAQQQAADVRAGTDKARAEIGAERERLIAEASKAAAVEKERLLAQAAQEIAKIRSEAEAAIVRDRAAAEAAIIDRASRLSGEIAQRLLARLPRQVALSAFLDGLCREVCARAAAGSDELTALTATDAKVEVVTAAPLSEEEAEQVRGALNAALGAKGVFAFRSDPALIAGIELHGPNTILRNSWRADLDRIGEELSHDRHQRQA